MILPSKLLALPPSGVDTGEDIAFSCMFDNASSSFLEWDTAGNADDTRIFTASCWFKRTAIDGNYHPIIGSFNSSTNYGYWYIGTDDVLRYYTRDSGGATAVVNGSVPLRDPSAWYHGHLIIDSTEAASADRIRLFINGVEDTGLTHTTPIALNAGSYNNPVATNVDVYIGRGYNRYSDLIIADLHHIDGLVVEPDEFGYFTDEGVWVPKAHTGPYGSKGYHLDFADDTDLGKDTSGNANHFTSSNMGTDHQFADTPTNNFATVNILGEDASSFTVVEGALGVVSSVAVVSKELFSTMGMTSGKWYCEVGVTSTYISVAVVEEDGGGVSKSGAVGPATIGVAVDADTGNVWFATNGVWDSGDPAAGTSPAGNLPDRPLLLRHGDYWEAQATSAYWNFGQRDFAYTPPSGFKALNSQNLPEPDIIKGSDYFAPVPYAGTSGAHDITMDFAPDLAWLKVRSIAGSSRLFDKERTVGYALNSDTDAAEASNVGSFSGWNSDGFGLMGSASALNASGEDYIAWCWKEGVIPGMGIVTYTGTGVARTVAHNLGATPELVMIKNRDSVYNWAVHHTDILPTHFLNLNMSAGSNADSTTFNDTAPDAINFTVGSNSAVNANSENIIAYLFASVDGFSKFGSYTGNGNADGPFVYCGFRPALVIAKRVDASANWRMKDSGRSQVNPADLTLFPDLNAAEDASEDVDLLSNGFKVRSTTNGWNTDTGTYIFMAFAEHPIKYARAR